MRSITIDEKTINAALACRINLENIENSLELPESTDEVKCVVVGDDGYMLSRSYNAKGALLVISLDDGGPLRELNESSRAGALGRILRCAIRMLEGKSRSIPISW